MTIQEIDNLVELVLVARHEAREAWRETGEWIRDHADDPETVARLDRCLILESNLRRLERLLAHERGAA